MSSSRRPPRRRQSARRTGARPATDERDARAEAPGRRARIASEAQGPRPDAGQPQARGAARGGQRGRGAARLVAHGPGDLGAARDVRSLLGPRPDRAQHRAAPAAAPGQGGGRAGDGHRPRDGPARRARSWSPPGRCCTTSACPSTAPITRPTACSSPSRSCGSSSTGSTTSRSAPWSSPRRCTRSSATGAAASRTRSRPGWCGSPTRSTWPRGAPGCRSRRVGSASTPCPPPRSTRWRSRRATDRAVRVEIKMNNSAGDLPGRRPAGDQAARHAAREPSRGGRDDRGRDREAAADRVPAAGELRQRGSRLRLAGSHDRRAGVLVDAVGLADLDPLEAGGRQLAAEVLLGQGAGDAAGPLLAGRGAWPRPSPGRRRCR